MARLKIGHFYRINSEGLVVVGEYMGREEGCECCICGSGHNAKCFNIHHGKVNDGNYETWGFGNEHMPEIIEDLGEEFISNR